MMAPKALARVAGLLYAGMGVSFVVAESLRGRIMGPGHAEAAADRIRASAPLFRVAMAVDLVSCTLFLGTAAALYVLLRHVDDVAAMMMVVFVALSVAVDCVSLVAQHAAVIVATHADHARALGQGGSDALVVLFAVHRSGLLVDELFWGLWLLPLGYLVARSGGFPRWLGVLLVVGGCSWVAQLFVSILAPELDRLASSLTFGAIGELVFMLWLIVKGARTPPVPAPIP